MAAQIHTIVRQPKAEIISPPIVGPKITAALEISMYNAKPFAIWSCGKFVTI